MENADDDFEKIKKVEEGTVENDFHAKIGQLIIENDFLSKALWRINGPSTKRR